VRLATAGWQLFAGDESAMPALAEMIEALPPATAAVALIEVGDPDDEQPIAATELIGVRWLYRGTTPPGESDVLDRALAALDIPDADRHAYIFGESRVVRRLRDDLGRRGLHAAEISAKGYWNVGRVATD
jgi:NADPH-dependent ferric siderophore reductase